MVNGQALMTAITQEKVMTIEQNSLLTNAMSVVASGANVSLDETSGLQNATATPTPTGDADDNLPALDLRYPFDRTGCRDRNGGSVEWLYRCRGQYGQQCVHRHR